jgi:hypothetical protein
VPKPEMHQELHKLLICNDKIIEKSLAAKTVGKAATICPLP